MQRTLSISSALILTNGIVTTTSSNLLLIGESATITNASSSSYIVGPLQRRIKSTAAFSFPVGASGSYHPAVLDYDNAASPVAVVRMEYSATDPGGNLPTGISSISTGGHYRMQSDSGTTTGDYSLTLRYNNAIFNPESRTNILVQTGAGPDYTLPANQSVDDVNNDVTAPVISTFPTDSPYILAFGAGGTSLAWNGGTGNWNVAGNWNPASIPTSTDDVTIDGGSSIGTLRIFSGGAVADHDKQQYADPGQCSPRDKFRRRQLEQFSHYVYIRHRPM